jgi:hypothetical protein
MSLVTPDAPGAPVPLDPALVARFLEAHGEVTRLVERLDRQYGRDRRAEDESTLLQSLARDERARGDIERVLARHGFASVERWSDVVYAISGAYGFAEPGQGLAAVPAQVEAAIVEIRADAGLSESEKADMIAGLEEEARTVEALRPPPGNIAAVRPHLARLRAILGED